MNMVVYTKEIPTVAFPSIESYSIKGLDEDMVSLTEAGFKCSSQYYIQGIPGSYKDCWARESVVEHLKKARDLLPDDVEFMIYDAYRPICVQQRLWNYYRRSVMNRHPEIQDDKELDKMTSFYVSKPSYDIMKPSLHNTGGAIDLTLVRNGEELDMGCKFDDFSHRAWTNHFEPSYPDGEKNGIVMNNRRLLYNVMTAAGFTNLPSEWWHYGYGTKFWGYFTGNEALYTGVLDFNKGERFPIA